MLCAAVNSTLNLRGEGTLYRVTVEGDGAEPLTILRSHAEFKRLHESLGRQRHELAPASPPLPSLPHANIFSSFLGGSQLSRLEALNDYLQKLLTNAEIAGLPALLTFLSAPTAAADASAASTTTPHPSSHLPPLPASQTMTSAAATLAPSPLLESVACSDEAVASEDALHPLPELASQCHQRPQYVQLHRVGMGSEEWESVKDAPLSSSTCGMAFVPPLTMGADAAPADGPPALLLLTATEVRCVQPRSEDTAEPRLQLKPEPYFTLFAALYGHRVRCLATGASHALVLCDGCTTADILSWGRGDHGQLGHGDRAQGEHTHPRPIEALASVTATAIACGARHSLVLTTGGRVHSFGDGSHGQLGGGDWRSATTPRQLPSVRHERAAQPCAGASPRTDTSPAGTVASAHVARTTPSGDGMVAAGAQHSLLVCRSGKAYACGSSTLGQLGTGSDANESRFCVLSLPCIVKAAAGEAHSVFLSNAGTVFTCGANTRGQLGQGDMAPRHWPTLVVWPGALLRVTEIVATADMTLCITHDGGLIQLCACCQAEHREGAALATVARSAEERSVGQFPYMQLYRPDTETVGTLSVSAACISYDGRMVAVGLQRDVPNTWTRDSAASLTAHSHVRAGTLSGHAPDMSAGREATDADRQSNQPTAGRCDDRSDNVACVGRGGSTDAGSGGSSGNSGGGSEDGSTSTGNLLSVSREGLVRLELGWLRGMRVCWLQLRGAELYFSDPSTDGMQSTGSTGTGTGAGVVFRTVPLEHLDAFALVGSTRLRMRERGGSELMLLIGSPAEALGWKLALQQARRASPRRAFLQDAIGEAMASRGAASLVEQARWLCIAAAWGETDEVCSLLRGGATVGGRHSTHRRTALHYASLNGHLATTRALLEHHADPNARDAEGGTALEAALEFGHVACAQALAAAGAALTARAEQLATCAQQEMAPGRLLAALRAAHWQSARGMSLLGLTTPPRTARSGSQLEEFARKVMSEHLKAERAWRETLASVPPPTSAAQSDTVRYGQDGHPQPPDGVGAAVSKHKALRSPSCAGARNEPEDSSIHIDCDGGDKDDSGSAIDGNGSAGCKDRAVGDEQAEATCCRATACGDDSIVYQDGDQQAGGVATMKECGIAIQEPQQRARYGEASSDSLSPGQPVALVAGEAPPLERVSAPQFPAGPELRRLCADGIPPELRCRAWPLLLSMRAPLEPSAANYTRLCQLTKERRAATNLADEDGTKTCMHLIRTDLARTFPSLGLFVDGGSMQSTLEEVLWAYCSLPEALPYCQGMSHLAAVILLHIPEPYLACACLSSLLEGYPVLRACVSLDVRPAIAFFDRALSQQLPALTARLSLLDIPSDLYLVPWLLTMFSRALPLSTACRIWDRVLADGEAELFRAAIALMALLQPLLLVAGFDEAVQVLQHVPMLGDAVAGTVEGGVSSTDYRTSGPCGVEVEGNAGIPRPPPHTSQRHLLAARHLAEEEVLVAISRVQLVDADYEHLLLHSILHGNG